MRLLKEFSRRQEGAAAVEFALAGTLFILTTLFILLVGTIAYLNQVLDYATVRASRQIVIGASQAKSTTATDFTQDLCGFLPTGFPCSDLVVNLYIVPKAVQPSGYYTYVKSDLSGTTTPNLTPGTGQFSLGARGDYQYLQVIYPITFLPTVFASMLSSATYNGKPAYLVTSTTAFRNEQF